MRKLIFCNHSHLWRILRPSASGAPCGVPVCTPRSATRCRTQTASKSASSYLEHIRIGVRVVKIFPIAIFLFSCGSEPDTDQPELVPEPVWIVCREEPRDEDGWEDCDRIHRPETFTDRGESL